MRRLAAPLLARHSLRSAEAAQLASALLVSQPDAASLPVVCFDQRLAEAAEREGFRVLGWP